MPSAIPTNICGISIAGIVTLIPKGKNNGFPLLSMAINGCIPRTRAKINAETKTPKKEEKKTPAFLNLPNNLEKK